MKNKGMIWMIGIMITVLVIGGCHKEKEDQPVTQEDTASLTSDETESLEADGSDDLLDGIVIDHLYSNSYLNIKIEIPESWHVMTSSELAHIKETGEALTGETTDGLPLFGITEYDLDNREMINSSLLINAYETEEKSIDALREKLDEIKEEMSQEMLPINFGTIEETELFGAYQGVQLIWSIDSEEAEVTQIYSLVWIKGWTLEIIGTGTADSSSVIIGMLGK